MKNYYRILNVRSNATDEEIKRSYRALAKRYHPDVNPGNKAASLRFADINEAYAVLSEPQKRAEYDSQLRQAMNNFGNQNAYQNQYEAQMQAQMQAKYQEGYNMGYKYGAGISESRMQEASASIKAFSEENERLKKQLNDISSDRSTLEQELFERDRELSKNNDTIQELEIQLQWLKEATGNTPVQPDPLQQEIKDTRERVRSLTKMINDINVTELDVADDMPSSLIENKGIRAVKDQLRKLNRALNTVESEVSILKEKSEHRSKLNKTKEILQSIELRTEDWAKKVRADKRAAKSTHYGTLGLFIWATDAEIDAAYEKLKAKYKGKTDSESEAEFKKIKQAYNTLADPSKRKEYNTIIGVSEEKIAKERKLIKENDLIRERYKKELAAKEFLSYFNELSSLAMGGDSDAQNSIGEIYYSGKKVKRDFKKAAFWFRESFERNNPAGMYNLAVCYQNGEGVTRNANIADSLFRQAKLSGYKPQNG